MLRKWLRSLENYKIHAIHQVEAVCANEKRRNLAIREIELNCMSVKNFLKKMSDTGYPVKEDLSRVDKYYNAFEDYRRIMKHIEYHLWELRDITFRTKKGIFCAKLARY